MKLCSIDGCEKKAARRGWCAMHYLRWYRHGDLGPAQPLAALRPPKVKVAKPTPEEAFWAKVEKTDTCWLWTAFKNAGGYGRFRGWMAHRWAYVHYVGPIPEGLHLDHLCRVRHCVNPAHLEPVTAAENVHRGLLGVLHPSRQAS